jgi:tetratricopeptide (TPR) repeat protein
VVSIFNISIKPWRFDMARDAVLAMVPENVDVCVSIDLDEVLMPGWRQEIERVWELGKTTRLRYKYHWGNDITFYYEKIHARQGYRWHHPCHEYPMPYGIEEVWANSDMLLVEHRPDPTKSRSQYLHLLEWSVREDPACPRNAFYYARELSFYQRWDDCITECERYLALPRATWPNERCYAYRVMGKAYIAKGDYELARRALMNAVNEAPYTREPWVALAELYYKIMDWPHCYAAACRALQIQKREFVYTQDPLVWGALPHDLAAISAWHMGLYAQALEQGEMAYTLSPDDARLRDNVDWYRKKGK